MKYLYFLLLILINYNNGYVTNANILIRTEQKIFNEILQTHNLPCHLQTARVKTFESAMEKFNRIKTPNDPLFENKKKINNIYSIPDLIGLRYVFYTKIDVLKFYHLLKLEKTIMYAKNYLNEPKENGYSAFHIRYQNEYPECPVLQLECQLYVIDDYYNAMYGNAKRKDKNYTLYF